MVDISVSVLVNILMTLFWFLQNSSKCQILLQGIFDTTNMVIYYAVTIEKSEKKVPSLTFTFLFVIKMILDLLRRLKETIFHEKK